MSLQRQSFQNTLMSALCFMLCIYTYATTSMLLNTVSVLAPWAVLTTFPMNTVVMLRDDVYDAHWLRAGSATNQRE